MRSALASANAPPNTRATVATGMGWSSPSWIRGGFESELLGAGFFVEKRTSLARGTAMALRACPLLEGDGPDVSAQPHRMQAAEQSGLE
jgi:hypothetical protein